MSPKHSSVGAKRAAGSSFPHFDVPDLFAALHSLLAQVPAGRVATYGTLAGALGDVRAARWVASYLLDPRGPVELPRHRIVLRDGALGKYWTGDVEEKASRLRREGVELIGDRIELHRFAVTEFAGAGPLQQLQQVQRQVRRAVCLQPPAQFPVFVGGVDVSYASAGHAGPVEAVGGYARVEVATGQVVWQHTIRRTVRFPYIPGYLSFRELPVLLDLLDEVRAHGELAPVLLVDGNGILHHRNAGIATHLGIAANWSTIGIGKSLLCGTLDKAQGRFTNIRAVRKEGEVIAAALQTTPGATPVYVSPGHKVDLEFAVELTRQLVGKGRIPIPIAAAHDSSRAAARAIAKPVR